MEKFTLDNDITVFYVTAKSFPDEVLEAHQQMHGYVTYNSDRKYFGISAPDKTGKIIYKSAAEELEKGEFSKHKLEQFMIKKGKYIFIDIKDFRKDIESIFVTFKTLLTNPNIDPNGCCIEWYISQSDVRCMVKLKD